MSLSNIQKTPHEVAVKSHTEVVENNNNEFVQRTIPRTLGYLAVPEIIKELSSAWTFDEVSSSLSLSGDLETLTFYSSGSEVGSIYVSWTHLNWNISTSILSALILEAGDYFLLEDGSSYILLE